MVNRNLLSAGNRSQEKTSPHEGESLGLWAVFA